MDRGFGGEFLRLMTAVQPHGAERVRRTKEGSRKAPSTRHMVRNESLLLAAEKKPYSSSVCAAGYTYSGVGALKLLGKLPRHGTHSKDEGKESLDAAFVDKVTKWLVSRQTLMLHEDDELAMADDEPPASPPQVFPPTFHVQGAIPVSIADTLLPRSPCESSSHDLRWAGFNGRCNKVADTCYAFWVGGTLGVSFCHDLI